MRLIDADALKNDFDCVGFNDYDDYNRALRIIDNAPTVEQPTGEWIPIKYRPLTTEERIDFTEHYGSGYCDEIDGKIFDCPMPEDGQEILVSGSWGVSTDVADNDIDYSEFIIYGLEGNGDWDGIDAWMPLPEPYKR